MTDNEFHTPFGARGSRGSVGATGATGVTAGPYMRGFVAGLKANSKPRPQIEDGEFHKWLFPSAPLSFKRKVVINLIMLAVTMIVA